MKLKIILFFLFTAVLTINAQEKDRWSKLNYLIGEWKGEGTGKPGTGEGTFSFSYDLDKNIIVRKNHTVIQAESDKPAAVHDDLLVIYCNYNGAADKAIYFDNEKHVINYSITFSGNSDVVFTSEKIPNVPLFRLTYSQIDQMTINTKFEMSQDGVKFFTYLEGKSKRLN